MDNIGKLFIIVVVTTFLLTTFLVFYNEFYNPPLDDFNHTQELNMSNLTGNVYFENTSDQYGNIISQQYHYRVYADIYSIDLGNNYTVQIKAYNSNGDYLEKISSNRSLSSLNSISEGSGRNLDYNYYSDELIDYTYVVFEIYDNNGVLAYNQTVYFDLDNVTTRNTIDYIGGQVW